MVSLADRAVIPQHVLVRFLDRESVLLNLETERYFGLDETGTRMWQVLTSARALRRRSGNCRTNTTRSRNSCKVI